MQYVALQHAQSCVACEQPMMADLGGKGKGKQEIIIDATQRDLRFDNDPDYYTQTEATKQFRQVLL